MFDLEGIRRAVDPRSSGRGDVRCPVHDDGAPSLSINEVNGKLVCHCHAGCSQRDVFDEVRNRAGSLMPTNSPVHIAPVERDWTYATAEGEPIARVCRIDHNGSKRIWQQTFVNGQWVNTGLKGETPFYNLADIYEFPTLPVLVVEGEKACDAAVGMADGKFNVTCWMGGVGKVDRVNLDCLEGREVILWPDADIPGIEAMQKLAKRLETVASSVAFVNIEGLPPKADAADVSWSHDELKARCGAAIGTPGQDPNALKLVFSEDISAEAIKLDQLLEDLLTQGGLSVMYGESNSGKSFLAAHLACAIAKGQPWLGKRTVFGSVMYVAGEGAESIKLRVLAHRQHYKVDRLALAVVPEAINMLDDNSDTARIITAAQRVKDHYQAPLHLIVIDTLARAFGGGNENASEDMNAVIRHADEIRQATGAHVLFIHHSGKDAAKGARGHSALRAATDTEIEVTADPENKLHTAEIKKQRDLSSLSEKFTGKFQVVRMGTDQWGKPITTCVVTDTDEVPQIKEGRKNGALASAIIRELQDVETSIKQRELLDRLEVRGYSGTSPYNAITRLVKDGVVTKVGDMVKLTGRIPRSV